MTGFNILNLSTIGRIEMFNLGFTSIKTDKDKIKTDKDKIKKNNSSDYISDAPLIFPSCPIESIGIDLDSSNSDFSDFSGFGGGESGGGGTSDSW